MKRKLQVAILLIGGEVPGGAERRIASFLQHCNLIPGVFIKLIVNSELLLQLKKSKLEPRCPIIELNSWFCEKFFTDLLITSPNNFVYKILKRVFKFTSSLFLSLQLGLYLFFNKADVLHVVLGGSRTIAFPYLSFIKSAIVCSVIGTEVRSYHQMWFIDQYILSAFLEKAHIVDALSEELYDLLMQKKLTDASKIEISGSFVNVTRPIVFSKKTLRVVFAARFVNGKNPHLFLDAIPIVLSKTNHDVHFFMLGNGVLLDSIKKKIYDNRLEKNITIKFHDDITDVLSESLIFCSLQEHENYPSRSLLEAMACGNAIVATDVGYTYQLVNNMTGIRVKASPLDVALAITSMIENLKETLTMGKQAQQLIIEKYSPEAYCEKMGYIYRYAFDQSLNKNNFK